MEKTQKNNLANVDESIDKQAEEKVKENTKEKMKEHTKEKVKENITEKVEENTKEKVIEKLKRLTLNENIRLVKSGDHAILYVLKLLKRRGIIRVLIQDQGGWLTYRDYAKRLNLEIIEVKTNYGLTNITDLKSKLAEDSVYLMNSMPGYIATEDCEEIYSICKSEGVLLVNDASGTIGRSSAKIGDIILGSFGKHKPVNLHYGGFLSTDNDSWASEIENDFNMERIEELENELNKLPLRTAFFDTVREMIIRDLVDFKIVHEKEEGINVVVLYKNVIEQSKLTEYCKLKHYPYTLCPRYIRVNAPAISIEVKRLME